MCRTMRCCVIDLYSYTIMHSFFPSSTHMTWVHFTDAARYFPFAGTVAFSFEPL